jgi:hypothetical protein
MAVAQVTMIADQMTLKKDFCRRVMDLPVETVEQLSQCLDDIEAYEPNEETIRVLKDSEAGRNLLGPYVTLEDMFRDFGTPH